MRLLPSAAALLAGGATALVIPDEPMRKQLSLLNQDAISTTNPNPNNKIPKEDSIQKWWDSLSPKDSILTSFEETLSVGLKKGVSPLADLLNPSSFDWPHWGGGGGDHGGGGGGHHEHPPHHGDPTKTIYDLIKSSKYTTKFAALVDEHPEIKSILETPPSTQNHTLFVPTDKAFERIPDHHKDKDKKPPKEFILALLKYHIVPGLYPVHHIFGHHTLPTNLTSHSLGHHPQRLRISTFGILPFHRKIFLNFFTKIIPPASDIVASNGIIHGIDHILIPPPSQEKIIELLPSTFSTFRLGMEITGLGQELSEREKEESQRNGGTLFAPTNRAFAKLGPRANAFLFSEYGKKYLKALLKYHIVANRTLYSDEFYNKPVEYEHSGEEEEEQEGGGDHGYGKKKKEFKRIDLPSLLDDKPISVGISKWKNWIYMKVNDKVTVVVQDGLARDGVIQVVGNVLIPPHKHHDGDHDDENNGDGEQSGYDDSEEEDDDDAVVDLEDLKARLRPYLEEERSSTTADRGSDRYFISEDL